MTAGPGPTAIGRGHELAAVAAFLEQDWPRALVLEGAAGIGKSTLLNAANVMAGDRGANTLVVRASEAERDLSFATLTAILPDRRLEPVLPVLPIPRRRALEVALRRSVASGPGLDGAALGLAVHDVLVEMARARPVLLVLDDLQWCDPSSGAALAFALRRIERAPVGFIGAIRVGGGVDPAATGPLLDAFPTDRCSRLTIGALSIGALGRLLEMRTGQSRPRSVIRRIAEAAEGNPLLALELASVIDADVGAAGPPGPLAIPASAEPLIADRLGRLSPEAFDVVLAVALAGRLPQARLASSGLPDGLAEALATGAVEMDGNELRPGHPLVGAAAIGRADPQRRRSIHRALADVAADPQARARHLALAADGPDADAARRCDEAAEDAARRGATATAAELAELAVLLTDPASERAMLVRRHSAAAQLRLASGDANASQAHVAAGRAIAQDPGERIAIGLLEMAIAHVTHGRAAARAVGDAIIGDAAGDVVLTARVQAAMLAWATEDATEERELATAVLTLLAGRETEEPEAASDALAVLADARIAAGEGPAFDLLERAMVLDRRRPGAVVGALRRYGAVLRTADRIDASRAAFAEVLEREAQAGLESTRVNDLAHAAWTEVLAGDHTAAARLLDASLDLAADLRIDATGTRVYRAHLDALLGDRASARAASRDGLTAAEAAADRWVAALWHRVIGTDDLVSGDPDSAADHLAVSLATALDLGIVEPNWIRVEADLVESLVAAGRLEEATVAFVAFVERASLASLPWSLVAGARAQAVLLAATDDLEGALATLACVEAEAAELPLALERARVDLVRGSILRRLRRVREARMVLSRARDAFAAAPSPPWERRAVAELARLGGRLSRTDALSPAERQVADLAAAGRSNREIAESLVVSVRTVESQLSSVYAKLGVRGRTSLAGVLAQDSRADGSA